MIVNEQKPIELANRCGAIYDEELLKEAIVWYSPKPVQRLKSVYLYGNYPAVTIYIQKVHIHRLILLYVSKGEHPLGWYAHHKNHNKMDARVDNLVWLHSSEHQSLHNKGRVISEFHKQKIREANAKRKGRKYKIYENPDLLPDPPDRVQPDGGAEG